MLFTLNVLLLDLLCGLNFPLLELLCRLNIPLLDLLCRLNFPLLDLLCRWRRNWRKTQCMRPSPWNRSGSDFLRSISWSWRIPVVITTPSGRRGSRSTNDPDPDLWVIYIVTNNPDLWVITLLQTVPICESLHCYKQSRFVSHINNTNNLDPDLWITTILEMIPIQICESFQCYTLSWSWFLSHYNITNDPDLWVITIL